MKPNFFCDFDSIQNQIKAIDPHQYAKSRNFLKGQVTYLSPFITHGIISLSDIYKEVLSKHSWQEAEKLISELAWREFFQRVYQARGEEIFSDLRFEQPPTQSPQISESIIDANTGIQVIDESIKDLYETGYMHNHARMWVASLACNVAQTKWEEPSKWLFYHLLDGDLASNTLSWQWIAASFSNKKYYANQENINRYGNSNQSNTFLDISYEDFENLKVPKELEERQTLELKTPLPSSTFKESIHPIVMLYSIWNLSPSWHSDINADRVLWLEPSYFEKFPISQKRIDFILHWALQIKDLQVFVGEKEALEKIILNKKVIHKKHPSHVHWIGQSEEAPWLFPTVSGYFKNFFSYWKEVQKNYKP